MRQRSVSKAAAAFALTLALGLPAFAAGGPGRGTSIDDWQGYAVLKGGKGYVQAPLGQLHYRDVGPRNQMPLVLLHQSPMSMIQWADVQNEFVSRGRRVITVDTPGNGNSDIPDHQPTIEEIADNLVALLDALKLKKVLLGGHHTGAQIATAFASRHPERVEALILHGAAMFSDEELARRQANIGARGRRWRALSISDARITRRNYLHSISANLLSPAASAVAREIQDTATRLVKSGEWRGVRLLDADEQKQYERRPDEMLPAAE